MAADLIKRMDFYEQIIREGDFGAGTLAVAFALLCHFYNGDTGRCDPGRAALAKQAGVDRDQVKRAVRELKRGQWFDVQTGGGTPTRFGPTTAYIPSFEQGANSTPVQIRPRVKSEPGANPSGDQGANSTPLSSKTIDEPAREVSLNEEQDSKAPSPSASPYPNPAASANGARAPRAKGKTPKKAPENNLALLEAFTPTPEQLARLRIKAPTVAHKLDILAEQFRSDPWWIAQFGSGKYSDAPKCFENFVIKQEGWARDRGQKPMKPPPDAPKPLKYGTPEARRAYDV